MLCPEDWRRRYILGEKAAPTGAMFLGRQVDEAITLYYRHLLEHGDRLSLDQVKDAFWDGWKAAAEAEREQLGISWEEDLREDRAVKLGLDALELSFAQLIPRLGDPVAVQRAVEYTLAPGLEWSVLCYLDLETRQPDIDGDRRRGRRLQGQDDAGERVQGRPRLPARRCTSPAAGSRATRPQRSSSRRSPSPARGARR